MLPKCVNGGKEPSLPTKDLAYLLLKTLLKIGKGELFLGSFGKVCIVSLLKGR